MSWKLRKDKSHNNQMLYIMNNLLQNQNTIRKKEKSDHILGSFETL